MQNKKITFLLLGFVFLFLFNSCQKEEGTTYSDVKVIIDVSCAVAGCHNSATMKANLDCSSYAGLQNVLTNGKFTKQVLELKTMPKVGTLSAEKIEKLKAWQTNSYKN